MSFLIGGDTIKQHEKELLQRQLDSEKGVLRELERHYKKAIEDIDERIAVLLGRQDADLQHVIFQVEYQKQLKTQVQAILEQLQASEFDTISEYLSKCYEEGFVGSLYSIQKQGVPVVFPVDQRQVVEAVQLDSKISEGLYTRLGKDVKELKKTISSEITRGISTAMTYSEIARNVNNASQIGLNRAKRIARTEGGRIQNKAAMDTMRKAKAIGADVVKRWSAALDARTRDSHARIDGEVKEVEEKFSNGLMYPKDPSGGASEVVNCRCKVQEIARWALDDEETKHLGNTDDMTDEQLEPIANKLNISVDELRGYSGQIIPVKAKNYDDFKRQYDKIWRYEGSDLQKEAEARIASYGKKKTPKPLANSSKSGTIDIEIDEFVPCLVDTKTGEVLDTVAREVTDRKSLKQYTKKNGWYISWNQVPADCTICSLHIKGDDAVQGLVAFRDDPRNGAIYGHWVVAAPHNRGKDKQYEGVGGHLFAIIADASIKAGHGGFFYGDAASDAVLKHYIEKLKALPGLGRRFYVDEEAAHWLLDKYNFESEG